MSCTNFIFMKLKRNLSLTRKDLKKIVLQYDSNYMLIVYKVRWYDLVSNRCSDRQTEYLCKLYYYKFCCTGE